MKKIYQWFRKMPKRIQNSLLFSATVVGFLSTLFTVLGISLTNIPCTNLLMRFLIVIVIIVLLAMGCYAVIGVVYKDSVTLNIVKTPVEIFCGDIFETTGMKVIGCDSHFDTRVDDRVISKRSLHGQLILNHGNADEIKKVVEDAAVRMKLQKNDEGLYDFPMGTIIRYDSSVDQQTYLMLAVTELDEELKAHTNMAKYELMLMKMWKEIDRVYASYDVVLPIIGTGILRFDDGPKDRDALLRCMLCTLNSSGVHFNSKIKVVIYGNSKEIPLYEYKDIFNVISRR